MLVVPIRRMDREEREPLGMTYFSPSSFSWHLLLVCQTSKYIDIVKSRTYAL
jgi:hypothetical protein